MASKNLVILIGNLGRDPEMRYTQNGKAIASFSMATVEKWKTDSGEAKEKTEWHKIIAWGKLGEICGEYLKKGSQIYVEGKLQTRSWEDKEGIKRYTTEINAEKMLMLGSRAKTENAKAKDSPGEEPIQIPDEDIPF